VPEGFTPWGTEGIFDPLANTLTLTSTTTVGSVSWQMAEDAYGPYTFQIELFVEDVSVVSTTVTVQEYGVFDIAQTGGEAEGLNGKVSVTIPEGALPEAVDLRIQPAPQANLPYSLSGRPFRLTAIGQTSGQPITQFNETLTVTVAYNEAVLPGDESGLVLFYFDETLNTWMSLPSWVDTENNVLYGYTTHFTDFDVEAQTWEMAHLPNLESFQVSTFTGAATYGLSIWTPPGPGGLQPSVSINYNSQTVDGATARTQAGIAGMGWSLNAGGGVQRNMNGTNDDLSDDTFSIVAGGISSGLLPIQDGDTTDHVFEYRTADESFWRVKYYDSSCTGCAYPADTWVAWDKTGTKYIFGDTPATRATIPYFSGSGSGCYIGPSTWYWGLSTTTNIHINL